MKMLLDDQRKKLLQNSKQQNGSTDFHPVVKFFTPWSSMTWLITEMDEDGRLFGLCDMGVQCPELGYVMLDEILSMRGPFGLRIERDRHFTPNKLISQYADEARLKGHIIS